MVWYGQRAMMVSSTCAVRHSRYAEYLQGTMEWKDIVAKGLDRRACCVHHPFYIASSNTIWAKDITVDKLLRRQVARHEAA